MVIAKETERNSMTTSIKISKKGDGYGAVAWRNESITVVEFLDILDIETDAYFPFRRELRIFQTTDDLPAKMPQEELDELLLKWVKSDRKTLPVVIKSQDEGMWLTTGFETTEIKLAPFALMYSEIVREYSAQVTNEPFIAPTQYEIDSLLQSGDNLNFATTKAFLGRMSQLQAVQAYVAAIDTDSPSPLKDVAKELGVDHVRARNLIQFARENSYLTGGRNKGKAIGLPTKLAHDLSSEARTHALALEDTRK